MAIQVRRTPRCPDEAAVRLFSKREAVALRPAQAAHYQVTERQILSCAPLLSAGADRVPRLPRDAQDQGGDAEADDRVAHVETHRGNTR